jgi:hypothetical protein
MELFVGRSDAFAEQQEDGSYRPIRRPMTREDYIAHGKGLHTYGIYTVKPASEPYQNGKFVTKLIVFDIDSGDPNDRWDIESVLDGWEIDYLSEDSGNKGWHVWVFFEHWAPASHAYLAGRAVLQRAGVSCEVYPKQQHVVDLGNLIKLPMGIHRVTGNWSRFLVEGWTGVEPINAIQLAEMADRYQEPPRPEPRPLLPAGATSEATFNRLMEEVASAPTGLRNETLFRVANWMFDFWRSNSREEIATALEDAAMQAGLSRQEANRTITSASRTVERKPLRKEWNRYAST